MCNGKRIGILIVTYNAVNTFQDQRDRNEEGYIPFDQRSFRHRSPRSEEEGKKIRARDGLIAVWTLLRFRFKRAQRQQAG